MLGTFKKTCPETPNLVKIVQKHLPIFAGDINQPQKHCCATLNIPV
jgi:hypothetical protein